MANTPDFDLSITATTAGYTVQVQAAYGVGALPPQPFDPPIDMSALPQARRDAAQWVSQARVQRLAGNEELRLARTFGSIMFDRLFAGEIRACFRESRGKLRPNERLRVRLHLPDQLAALPWELLYDPRDSQFLALAADLALVRYPDMPAPSMPLRVAAPLQVVAILASPMSEDYGPINLDRELRRLQTALRGPIEQGQIALDIIRGPSTLSQLRTRLRRPVHILHVFCHGDLDHVAGEGVLIFEDADGAPEPVNAELLRMYLQEQRGHTRLVLLNACLGALHVQNDPFSSVGTALVRGGVAAVIAMQFELAEDAAAELTEVFYDELAAGKPADLALTKARQHLYGRYRSRLDWVVPVMFLRSDDGLLFNVIPTRALVSPPVQAQAPVAASVRVPRAAPDTSTEQGAGSGAAKTRRDLKRWYPLLASLMVLLIAGTLWARSRGSGEGAGLTTPTPGNMSGTPLPTDSSPLAVASTVLSSTPTLQSSQTKAPAQIIAPPDARIAFVSTRDGNYEIYTMKADGSDPRNLTRHPDGDYNPAWSPDGMHIAFLSDRDRNGFYAPDQPYNEIYIMNADGSDQRRITFTSADEGVPSWSPDGCWIAFQSNEPGNLEIYKKDVCRNTGSMQLTTTPSEERYPTWTPDGHIAFLTNRNGKTEIYVMDADGSGQRKLRDDPADQLGPAWSPDGLRVAFVLEQNGKRDIYVMNADGNGEQQLTNTPDENEGVASWSPDGRYIVYQIGDEPSSRELYTINIQSQQRIQLTNRSREGGNYFPAWAPR